MTIRRFAMSAALLLLIFTSFSNTRAQDGEGPEGRKRIAPVDDTNEVVVPDEPTESTGRRWALLIGINRFGSGIPQLSFAAEDAYRIHDALLSHPDTGYAEERIHVLTTDAGTMVDRSAILGALERLARLTAPGDGVLVFISTHGVEIGGLPHLVPSDMALSEQATGLIPLSEFLSAMDTIPAKEQALAIDACHSGLDRSGRWGANATRMLESASLNRAVLSSSKANEESQELQELRGGIFGYYLARALTEHRRDLDFDGRLSVEEAMKVISEGAQGSRQTPWFQMSASVPVSLIRHKTIDQVTDHTSRVGTLRYAYHTAPTGDASRTRVTMSVRLGDVRCDRAKVTIVATLEEGGTRRWTKDVRCELAVNTVTFTAAFPPVRVQVLEELLNPDTNAPIARLKVIHDQ